MAIPKVSERLVRKVVLAALKGEPGSNGWLKIDAHMATDREISLAVLEAKERGLVKACDVTHLGSPYPEWRLVGPSGFSAQFLRETRFSKKLWALLVIVIGSLLGVVKWLIPVIISLYKRG